MKYTRASSVSSAAPKMNTNEFHTCSFQIGFQARLRTQEVNLEWFIWNFKRR